VAAGSAALLQPGTELCHSADIKRLFREVELRRVWPNGLETRWPASIGQPSEEAVASADDACGLDRQCPCKPCAIACRQQRSFVCERQCYDLGLPLLDNPAARRGLTPLTVSMHVNQIHQLVQIGFDQIHTFGQSGFQRWPRGIEQEFCAVFSRRLSDTGLKVVRYDRRQASTGNQVTREGLQ